MGVTENRKNVSIFISEGRIWLELIIKSLSKIKGEDPTIVKVPPKIAQKPIGISNCESGISVLTEILLTTGKNRAAAPTFCIKLEIIPTLLETIGTILVSLFLPYFSIVAATLLIKPALSRPAPMIITAIIEITAFDEKPAKRSDEAEKRVIPENWLRTPRVTITIMAVKSILKSSVTNKIIVVLKTSNIIIISKVSSTGIRSIYPFQSFNFL